MKGFKRCEKGHMYKENVADCPYCQKGSTKSNDKTEVAGNAKLDKTEIFVDSSPKTEEVKPAESQPAPAQPNTDSAKRAEDILKLIRSRQAK